MTTTGHTTGTRDEHLAARLALLEREKTLTRLSDELAAERAALPWVRVEKTYTFDSTAGSVTLADLFGGRSQLLVQHFMFHPDWDAGCRSCSSIRDGIEGVRAHLEHHDVAFAAVSRAPLEKLLANAARMGWTAPWVSSYDSDFNFDFGVSSTDERPMRSYNLRTLDSPPQVGELPGMSAFALVDGEVFHTYSAFSRGLDAVWGMYPWLDRAPLGRNEGDAGATWLRLHDEYETVRA